MIDDTLIIDGVVHAFDFSDDNRAPGCDLRSYRGLQTFWHEVVHGALESPEPGYSMSLPEFTTRWHAEDLAHTFFVESEESVGPTARIAAYVAALLNRYPDIDTDAGEDSPWSTGPLLSEASGPLVYFPMVWSRCDEVSTSFSAAA